MKDEIRGIIGSARLTSKSRVIYEGMERTGEISAAPERNEITTLGVDLERALARAQEVRQSVEIALKNLSPD